MISLDNETIEFPCPQCGFYNPIFFKQARLRDVIICRGCKSNIQLDDQMNECRKAERAFRKAVEELEKTLKNLNIKINI
jgi:hypothetical protein